MKKFLKYFLIIIAVVGVGGYVFLSQGAKKSPIDNAYFKTDSLYAKVFYCRPYTKNRMIFAHEDLKPLQPYGKYWRLGANEATKFLVNRDVYFGDKQLAAGEYILYAIPGAEEFEIVVNSEVGRWGFWDADKTKDVLSIKVPVEKMSKIIEQFTIEFIQIENGALMQFTWSDVKFSVPIHY